jgi:riboflavin synthase
MFTGIIESVGVVLDRAQEGTNITFLIKSPISHELKIDQSVSHNGVCLTVTGVKGGSHSVTAVRETLGRSTLGILRHGERVNLERCMLNNGRFDGHIVQGHVDTVATCTSIQDENGSWLYDFTHEAGENYITVEKGSISVNGISLTCFNSNSTGFRVAIIPYTHEHTNFKELKKGAQVNLEFDILGKYIRRIVAQPK